MNALVFRRVAGLRFEGVPEPSAVPPIPGAERRLGSNRRSPPPA